MSSPLLRRAGAYVTQRLVGGRAAIPQAGSGAFGRGGLITALAFVAIVFLLLPLVVVQAFLGGVGSFLGGVGGVGSCSGKQQEPSKQAQTAIPANYLRLYRDAGEKYHVPWTILAGVGRVETDHGRLDANGVHSGTNVAGAAGPMQFLLSTWETYGVDGNGDGRRDVYEPKDAIPAAARYLKASGAPADLHRAIFAYNHAEWYVDMVLDWASRYANGGAVAVAANFGPACVEQALGQAPSGAAGKVIQFARAQLGEPYVWGAEGPNVWDCSGLVMMAYREAGVSIPRVTDDQITFGRKVPKGHEKPGDLVFFRYDSGYVGHVGIVIGGGKMINAPQTGDVVKIAPYDTRDNVAGFTRPIAPKKPDEPTAPDQPAEPA